jgi:bifunctional UDP-N-acetylglucosamine pyrophosphorylase/glucosamine-1-phosphate N-acetyltransferase
LDYLLDGLSGRVEEVFVVVGYRAAQIRRWLEQRRGPPATRTILQTKALGTGDALLRVQRHLKSSFLVLNGDDFYDPMDIDNMLQAGSSAVLVAPVKDPQNRGVVTVRGRRIVDLVEKPRRPASKLAAIGMYRLGPEIFPILRALPPSPRGEIELPGAIAMLAREQPMVALRRAGLWYALGYPWDLLAVNHLWLRRSASGVRLGSGSQIGPGAVLQGPVEVGRGVSLGAGCRVTGPAVLGDGVRIGVRTRIIASVLLPGVVVAEGAVLEHSVLGEEVQIGTDARLQSKPPRGTVRVVVKGIKTDTGLKRLGAIVGDRARVAAGSVLRPGTLIAPGPRRG